MISNLLIDLDGTLTDPKSGIIGSVQYTLRTMGQEAPKASDLLWLIGPPLQGSFKILLDGSGLDVHEAIKIFRERFGSVGLFENAMYDGVPEFLAEQSSANKRLFIASTKPYVYISRILKHLKSGTFLRVSTARNWMALYRLNQIYCDIYFPDKYLVQTKLL
jgi:phosphoglycolate phosphatase